MDSSARTPVHLWIVGIVSALWNAVGALDYTMTQVRAEAWMANLTPDQIAWFDSAPAVAHASWAFGVWGAFLGSLLLLARSRFALWSFLLSIAGLAVNTGFQMTKPMPAGAMSETGMLVMHVAIWAIALLLLVYAFRMRRAGILR